MISPRAMALLCSAGMLVCIALARLTVPQEPRPPVPDAITPLAALAPRIDRLAWRVEVELRIREAERAFLLARTMRERERATRSWIVARRSP